VVVFHHGWLAWNPGVYGAWIDHLVRSGRVVIFPRYQHDWATRPADFLPNTVAAVRDAFDVLETAPGHVRPDRDRFALIGHSAGGNLAALLAATCDASLPRPRALVVLMPGEVLVVREPVLEHIPEETLWSSSPPRMTWWSATTGPGRSSPRRPPSPPRARSTSSIGPTATVARAGRRPPGPRPPRSRASTPAAARSPATRWTGARPMPWITPGFWRLADITLEAGFSGATLDDATGDGELFRHLGYWSDGHAVARPIVGDDLSAIPRVFPNNGSASSPGPPRGHPLVTPFAR
jgi:acetyl esterase/lipase